MKKIIEIGKKNKMLVIGILACVCIVIFGMVLLSLDNNTLAVEEDKDSLSISCPETSSPGQIIECFIVLESKTIVTQGVNGSYNIPEGMQFVSFEYTDVWNIYVNDKDGFVFVEKNFEGVTGTVEMGKVKFSISEDAVPNSIYKVGLAEVTIGDGGSTSVTFKDVLDEIRILSNINTLNNITLNNGTLNETFDKNKTEYSATVNSDKVTIGVEKTDENSNVTGDVGQFNLHYGTNIFNIVVTSETGDKRTYKLSVFRTYDFKPNNYVYNKDGNYIYTGTDTKKESILSNISLPTELSADVVDNKLVISYGTEKILGINIVNFTSNKYTLLEKLIYIESNLNYTNLINTFSFNGVVSKVYDKNGNAITTGVVSEGYKFKLYHGDTLLDEFTFNEEYFKIENLNVDDETRVIKRIVLNTTYESLLSNINTTGVITIKDQDGKVISDKSSKVKTGDVIEITLNSGISKYTMSVLGDLNGSGSADLGDVALLYRHLKGKTQLELSQIAAGDVINNGSIKVNDVSRIYRYVKGKITEMEVE